MTHDASPSDRPLQQDVLDELGDDGLQRIAGLLDTDAAGARDMVGTTMSTLSGDLPQDGQDEVRQAVTEAAAAEPEPAPGDTPLQGVATLGGGLGGMLSGGLAAGMLAKVARPVANAVAKKTGLPPATVTKALEVVLPVALAVLTKRAATKSGAQGTAPGAGGASGGGGLGDILGQILGGGTKR
ncbi:DUF937 domain-containing protein [Streptomyces sp. NBC_00083]|uniref:DUF937 domain-containing protein n=1 Tax=Streptomyces sp. NBC_00083 TaxID=2975647 RepID=UPI002258F727|nr:DUF937 domain-containing protein [Streptomyces sp. NBC_00083]MCX5382328.1 DUF937 domain-containing protein [Streptomyces sp. NBC_00083]